MQEAALALAPGVTSAAGNFDGVDEDEDEELLSPAERRAKRIAESAARPPIYNAEAMHEKLEDISWPSEVLAHSCLRFCKGERLKWRWLSSVPRALHGIPKTSQLMCCLIRLQAAWDESLVITGEDTAQVENIDDDLSRELAFYNQVCMLDTSPPLSMQPQLQRG